MMHDEIVTQIAQELIKKNYTIYGMIVNARVEYELENRKTMAIKVILKIGKLKLQLAEFKQTKIFDIDGNGKEIGFTEEQNQRRININNEIEKYELALKQALGDEHNWKQIEDLISDGGWKV